MFRLCVILFYVRIINFSLVICVFFFFLKNLSWIVGTFSHMMIMGRWIMLDQSDMKYSWQLFSSFFSPLNLWFNLYISHTFLDESTLEIRLKIYCIWHLRHEKQKYLLMSTLKFNGRKHNFWMSTCIKGINRGVITLK